MAQTFVVWNEQILGLADRASTASVKASYEVCELIDSSISYSTMDQDKKLEEILQAELAQLGVGEESDHLQELCGRVEYFQQLVNEIIGYVERIESEKERSSSAAVKSKLPWQNPRTMPRYIPALGSQISPFQLLDDKLSTLEEKAMDLQNEIERLEDYLRQLIKKYSLNKSEAKVVAKSVLKHGRPILKNVFGIAASSISLATAGNIMAVPEIVNCSVVLGKAVKDIRTDVNNWRNGQREKAEIVKKLNDLNEEMAGIRTELASP